MISKKKPRAGKNTGDEIIRGLTGFRDALEKGESLPRRFTMRTVELQLEPRDWSADDLKALREALSVSQAVFAKLIGTSVKTVQGWEHGNEPSVMAKRLLECIESDLSPWKDLLQKGHAVKERKTVSA